MNDKLNRAALSVAIEEGRKCFMPDFQLAQTDETCLGMALSHFFQWDGVRIMDTAAEALEDANFHNEAAMLRGLVESYGVKEGDK